MSASSSNAFSQSYLKWAAVVCLGAILAAESIGTARRQSQTWDEAYHMLAGYRYWQGQDFGINSEHPPLEKLLATIPLVYLRPHVPLVLRGTSKQEGFVTGRQFLYANDADRLLLGCRLAAGLLTLTLALLVFEAAHCMFGSGVALLALAFTVFEPNILAHGALVTTDVGSACCLFASVYAFFRYVKGPTPWRLLECGFLAGVSLAVKHSGILVFPILGLLAIVELCIQSPNPTSLLSRPSQELAQRARLGLRLALALVVIGAVAVVVLWSSYGFRFRARPNGLNMTPPLEVYIHGVGTPGLRNPLESRAILALYRLKLLPEAYLYGLVDVLTVSEGPRPTFILGDLYPEGRWFYFPVAFLIKSTLGFLLSLVCALAAKSLRDWNCRREVMFMAIPPAAYFAASLTSGLDIGVRHILPVYPFLLVIAAAGAGALVRQGWYWRFVIITLVALHAVSSARAYPDYTAYSNEAGGGPERVYRFLSDSNVDWGQGLIAAKNYLDHEQIQDCWLAYFGSADPSHYGIPCKLLWNPFLTWWGKPVDIVPALYEGTVLISATELDGTYSGPDGLNPYEPFRRTAPVANIGGSILAFRGRFDMSRASALSRTARAWQLQAGGQLDLALVEGRQAVALAPDMTYPHFMLGYLLEARKQPSDAQKEYRTALALARSAYPEYQWFWIPFLKARLKN
jgi:hypothetical protein